VASLRVTEIFHSLQGESRTIGWPTVFVRLTGCPLRCVWCDTAYAFSGGARKSIPDILDAVAGFEARHVCVTGGEPLAQPDCLLLLDALVEAGYEVSLETSGALDIAGVNPKVVKVMDLKPPGSGESAANRFENLAHLNPADQIKFVIRDDADYRWARDQVREHGLTARCEVLFSPVAGEQDPADLAERILHDRLDVRFQIQLHKYLWGDRTGV
jgi:7-carboxy-7-deazaguanine synthase